jgi:flavorubredoxin
VESVNAEFCSVGELATVIKSCNGFVVGSPTLAGHMPTPMKVKSLLKLYAFSSFAILWVHPKTNDF